MRRSLTTLAALGVLLAASACGPKVDVAAALRVDGVATGWADAGTTNGLNKLVPTVSLTLTNVSNETLKVLQVNAVFRRAGSEGEWGARFASAADPHGLPPGQSTQVLMLSSDLGYTGTDRREALLHHAQFVDTDVDLFAKFGSAQWVRLGRYPVRRQLVAALRP